MAVDPVIYQIEQKYRAALLAGDTNARTALFKAYTGSFKAVSADLAAVTAKIGAAQLAGEPISASWLMQQQKYRDLQGQIATMNRNMATALGTHLPADQLNAASAAETLVGHESGPIFHKLPNQAIQGVIGTTTTGSPLRTLLDSFNVGGTQDASRFVRSRLIAGISLGRAPARIAQEIASGVESLTLSRALTISRTETQRALRRATQLSIAANKDLIAGWVWRSGADERTCAACFSLHGTFFPGSTPMRAHPNCRCIMIPKRIVKDDPYHMSGAVKVGNGSELFKALSPESQMKILGPGRYDLYKSGKVSLNQMRTMRNNSIWGPSYQVKPLRDIKADLDKPPPAPKPPKPPPPPKPTVGPPPAPVVDEVLVAETKAIAAEKAVPVAPKATPTKAVDKARVKVAAEESRLVEIAQLEKSFYDDIPTLDQTDALAWRQGYSHTDVHMIKMRFRSSTGDIYGLPEEARQIIRGSFEGEYRYVMAEARSVSSVFGPDMYEWVMWRTKTPTSGNLYGSLFTDPEYMQRVLRALPSRTQAMNTIMQKTAVTNRLNAAKRSLYRLENPATARAVVRETPKALDNLDLQDAQNAAAAARSPILTSAEIRYKSFDELASSGNVMGKMTNNDIVLQTGEVVPSYGMAVRTVNGRTYLVQKASGLDESGYQMYSVTRVKAGITRAEIEARLSGYGAPPVYPWSEEWMAWVDGLPPDVIAAQRAYVQVQRDMTAWQEFKTLREIAGKNKPIGEVATGVEGVSIPIPQTSSFAGKPRKWTTRGDDKRAMGSSGKAKDEVSYQISERLLRDDSFIKSMAENDNLGDWILGAGRTARPAVTEAAGKWRAWSPAERERFIRSGNIERGYYEWSPGVDGPVRGIWHDSTRTEGAEFVYDWTSQMVQQWAVTSGDSHILSVGLQRAAMEEFSLQSSTTLSHFEGRRHSGGYGVPESDSLLDASQAFYEMNGQNMRHFLREMYNVTQEELAWSGISTVRVIRGVGSTPKATAQAMADQGLGSLQIGDAFTGPVDLQPMSSFAVDTATAQRFGRTLIYVDIPASWVVGTCRTGFGCLNEFEWVVLGGPMQATVYKKSW